MYEYRFKEINNDFAMAVDLFEKDMDEIKIAEVETTISERMKN